MQHSDLQSKQEKEEEEGRKKGTESPGGAAAAAGLSPFAAFYWRAPMPCYNIVCRWSSAWPSQGIAVAAIFQRHKSIWLSWSDRNSVWWWWKEPLPPREETITFHDYGVFLSLSLTPSFAPSLDLFFFPRSYSSSFSSSLIPPLLLRRRRRHLLFHSDLWGGYIARFDRQTGQKKKMVDRKLNKELGRRSRSSIVLPKLAADM